MMLQGTSQEATSEQARKKKFVEKINAKNGFRAVFENTIITDAISIPLRALVEKKERVITIPVSSTLSQAIEILSKEKIHSAPLSNKNGDVIFNLGLLSYHRLVEIVAMMQPRDTSFKQTEVSTAQPALGLSLKESQVEVPSVPMSDESPDIQKASVQLPATSMKEFGALLTNATISELLEGMSQAGMGLLQRNTLDRMNAKESVEVCLTKLSQCQKVVLLQEPQMTSSGTQQQQSSLVSFSADPLVVGIASHFDLLKFAYNKAVISGSFTDQLEKKVILQQNLHVLAPRKLASLKDKLLTSIADPNPPSLRVDNFMSDAVRLFRLLPDQVPSIAIVEKESGELIGNLSQSDLRHMFHKEEEVFQLPEVNTLKMASFLQLSIGDYLKNYNPSSLKPNLVTADLKTESLGKIIHRLLAHNLRSIWAIDDKRKVEACLSVPFLLEILNAKEYPC